jgi:hypothetical protein
MKHGRLLVLGTLCHLLDQTEGFHSPKFLEVGPTVGEDTTASALQTNKKNRVGEWESITGD